MKPPAETIDIHVHFGSPDDAASGCYWSKEFERTAAYIAMLLLTKTLFKRVRFETVFKHLTGVVNDSKLVARCVLLALDEVYDDRGNVRRDETHLHVPNRCIAGFADENPKIRFGASIHPYRPDWREELDFCLERGAVLCKWIPSSQQIDPLHPKCSDFYKILADHNLPLLSHAGPEYSIPSSADRETVHRLNNPERLRAALDAGVTVIVAHCSLPYFWFLDADFQDDFKAFLKLFGEADSKGWKLYADLSALTGFFRLPYIRDEIIGLPHERLLLGSDYPIPLSELSYHRRTDFFSWLRFIFKVMRLENPLDKNCLLIREMGFKDCVFTNASGLFSRIRRPAP